MRKYFDLFHCYQDVIDEFFGHEYGKNAIQDVVFPDPSQVLIAIYGHYGYSGDAKVVFKDRKKNLYLVEGSHCSCYGLDGQWKPDVTNKKALGAMVFGEYAFSEEAIKAWYKLFPKTNL